MSIKPRGEDETGVLSNVYCMSGLYRAQFESLQANRIVHPSMVFQHRRVPNATLGKWCGLGSSSPKFAKITALHFIRESVGEGGLKGVKWIGHFSDHLDCVMQSRRAVRS
jgi:hypothetical protein